MRVSLFGKFFIAVIATATVTSVYAQNVLEEVTVTARKRAENVQEVPISVTAFTADQIQAAGIERPVDYLSPDP